MGEYAATRTRLQAYQFELRGNEKQTHPMLRFAGACRLVFNRTLALQQEIYELCGFRGGLCRALGREGEMEGRTGDVLVDGRAIAGVAAVTEESQRDVGPTFSIAQEAEGRQDQTKSASRTAAVQEEGAAR